MLSIGDKAPPFSLRDSDGCERSLHNFLAQGPLVLFFYPADFTRVCTAEACMFRDRHAELANAGIHVVGISPQDADSHRRFKAEYKLPYDLLSDPDRAVISRYAGSWLGLPLPVVTRRVTYLIDSEGVVRDRVLADLSASAHARIVAAAHRLAAPR